MKALLSKHPGGPETLVLDDLPEPIPGPREVRIAVRACGVDGVEHVRVGDRVLLAPVRNGMAEKAVGLASNCWKIRAAMPFDAAAVLLMTYGTSQHALKDRAQLRSGETLLVLGAAGGVGLAAVELGKAMGGARGGGCIEPGEDRAGARPRRRRGGAISGRTFRQNSSARAHRSIQGGLRRRRCPAITERFPLARGAEAIARLGAREARGKVVVMGDLAWT
jgi:NADPH:quinone reductase-like Zn-dependent oxidoreductase